MGASYSTSITQAILCIPRSTTKFPTYKYFDMHSEQKELKFQEKTKFSIYNRLNKIVFIDIDLNSILLKTRFIVLF